MPPIKLPYREGSWFAVPLEGGGFSLGVVARMRKRGKILLCYFFGPRRSQLPELSDAESLSSGQAVIVHQVGDLGLITHRWPVLGELPDWQRELWRMPIFSSQCPLTGRWRQRIYDDNDPGIQLRELPGTDADAALPSDGLAGEGFMVKVLSKLM